MDKPWKLRKTGGKRVIAKEVLEDTTADHFLKLMKDTDL